MPSTCNNYAIASGNSFNVARHNFVFINPGVPASRALDKDGEPVKVILEGNPAILVNSTINRRAIEKKSVRIIGNNHQIAEWFQANFNQGDEVSAGVIDKQTILPGASNAQSN